MQLKFDVQDRGPALKVIGTRWEKDFGWKWSKDVWESDFTIGIKCNDWPEIVQNGIIIFHLLISSAYLLEGMWFSSYKNASVVN